MGLVTLGTVAKSGAAACALMRAANPSITAFNPSDGAVVDVGESVFQSNWANVVSLSVVSNLDGDSVVAMVTNTNDEEILDHQTVR